MSFFNAMAARSVPFVPKAIVHRISRRYIAGDDIAAAVARIEQLHTSGFAVTVDVLGEGISDLTQADANAAEYLALMRSMHARGLRGQVSVKPSAMGLLLDEARCESLLEGLLVAAAGLGISVCLDMEEAFCTQRVIDLALRLRMRHPHVGLAVQAYLKRTPQDLGPLMAAGLALRVCKGIYVEDPSLLVEGAATDRQAINRPFLDLVDRCFEQGTFVGIATHDEALVAQVVACARERDVDHAAFEFQMLLGVCEPLRDSLLGMGFAVRIYLPYGRDWYGYSTRRLKENPRMAGHVLKALFRA